jgi:hypothetical protein
MYVTIYLCIKKHIYACVSLYVCQSVAGSFAYVQPGMHKYMYYRITHENCWYIYIYHVIHILLMKNCW